MAQLKASSPSSSIPVTAPSLHTTGILVRAITLHSFIIDIVRILGEPPVSSALEGKDFVIQRGLGLRTSVGAKKLQAYLSGELAKPTQYRGLGISVVNSVSGVVTGAGIQVIKAAARSDTEIVSETVKGGGLRGKLNKVVLAYSGGLDTSVIVPWLRENYGCEVVCFTADVGQGIKELDGLEQKAKASGACQLVVKDLKEEFVKDYIFPCLRAGAVYERKYLLGTSMARPVIAKAMVDVAKEVGADAVRFELTFFALNPKLNVVAPWREWDITGREDAIEYAKKHNIPVPVTKKSIYSRDRNLWHLSHEGDILEDPANEPKKDMYMMSVDPEDAPDQAEYVEIGIEAGLPVSVNGKRLSPASLLAELNEIGGRHGIGRIDMVENRLVGMKSRGVYETPGGTILFAAARELEFLTLDRETIQVKDSLALKYAELVYAGRWFDPLRESMDAFMQKITETTTGSVTLKLYKGSVTATSRTSPFSLYRQDISSFESGQIYDQADAAGFIRLYGLPMRVRAMLEQGI
ncbi:Argininosuccinate synthase [Vigna angularis]|uniref:argininosuccinate synthase n=1 Tax=Phaseolus angularis TaxID=3914 RepID=A0A8T0L7W6_PHAAN|nr:Argininosuccinate synthase [Vigna angularis]